MIRKRSTRGSSISRRMTTGTATLYGSITDIENRQGWSKIEAKSALNPSATSMRTRSKGPTVSSNPSRSLGSTSTARTEAPRSASARVSEPRPAPTSRTWESGPTSASSAMRRASAGSMRKCCPSAFLGRIPWRAASARSPLGVRTAGGSGDLVPGCSELPGDPDVGHALPEGCDLGEGRVAEVDDPSGDAVGATVVDYHSDRLAVVQIVHGGPGAEGEPQMGGVVSVSPAEVIPGGLADLVPVRTGGNGPLNDHLADRFGGDPLGKQIPRDLRPVDVCHPVGAHGTSASSGGDHLGMAGSHILRVLDEGFVGRRFGPGLDDLTNPDDLQLHPRPQGLRLRRDDQIRFLQPDSESGQEILDSQRVGQDRPRSARPDLYGQGKDRDAVGERPSPQRDLIRRLVPRRDRIAPYHPHVGAVTRRSHPSRESLGDH